MGTQNRASKYINFQMAGGRRPYKPNAGNGTTPARTALFSAAGFEVVAGARYTDIGWTATGDFVGQQIAGGTLQGQQNVTGFTGSGLVNSFFGQLIGRSGDNPQGRLTSPTFIITKPYVNFLVGGGNHPYVLGNSTSVVLMVNGAVVRSATGKNDERLDWTNWNVSEFVGQQAQIVIVDENAGGWGHINADDFQASDQPAYPQSDELSVNLLVDGKVVYSETGDNDHPLTWRSWNVAGLMGKQAQIRIVDKNTGDWGHVLVDNIIFSDQPKLHANWVDYGSDFYAAVTWDNVQGRRLGLGWLSNWDYAGVVPTSPWRGAQTMAREFRLRTIDGKVRMVMLPAAEITTLRNKLLYSATGASLPNGEKKLDVSSQSKAYEIQARIAPGTATGFGVKVHTGTNGEETVVGYDVATGQVYLDRSRSNDTGVLPPTFFTRHNAPLPYRGTPINLRIVVDTSSVTVYAGNEVVLTDVIFPDPNSNGISLFA